MWQKCTRPGELSSSAFVNFSIPVPRLGFCLPPTLGPPLPLAVILFLRCPAEAPPLGAEVLCPFFVLLISPPPAPDTPQEGGEGAAQRSHMDLGFVLGHPGFALSPAPASSNSSWRAWQVPLSLPQFPYLQIEYWSLPHRAVVRLCERKLC